MADTPLALAGALLIGTSWIAVVARRSPLSAPVAFIAIGATACLLNWQPSLLRWPEAAGLLNNLAKLALIIALVGTGLTIDRPPGLRRWSAAWRLVGIGSGGGRGGSRRPPGGGTAVERRSAHRGGLGADRSCAGVQCRGRPARARHLMAGLSRFTVSSGGRRRRRARDRGTCLLSYGCAERFGGYGFLATFVYAVSLRWSRPDEDFHRDMAKFAGQAQQLLLLAVLLLFAGWLGAGALEALSWRDVVAVFLILFAVRPVTAAISLVGSG